MRSDREKLLDIQEAISSIEKYAQKGRDAFVSDELIQTWVIHHLLVLGEAAAKMSEGFQKKYPDIPWSKIIGMRNILIHQYFGIDFDVVWSVVESDLPKLKRTVEQLL